jgi:hypothetical protein
MFTSFVCHAHSGNSACQHNAIHKVYQTTVAVLAKLLPYTSPAWWCFSCTAANKKRLELLEAFFCRFNLLDF